MNFRKITVLIVLTISLGIASGILIGKMSFFRLKEVEIEVHNVDFSDTASMLSELRAGMFIYGIDLENIERELECYRNIKDVQITIVQNSKLQIKVYGRYPVMKLKYGFGIDPDGFLMNIDDNDLMEVEIDYKELISEDRIIPPAGVLLMPAKLLGRGYEFPLVDRLVLTRDGLLINTTDDVAVFIGNTNFLEAYKIIEVLKGTNWWNKNNIIDLSMPGEILMKKKYVSNGGY